MTTFEPVYRRPPPSLPSYIPGTSSIEAVNTELQNRDAVLIRLKTNLTQAQSRMKCMADKKRLDKNFDVGTWVLLKLQPYRQQSLANRFSQKLSKRFFGPYQILDKVGKVAYKLQLPEGSRIHPVFHVSQVKPYYGPSPQSVCTLPLQDLNNQPLITPLAILGQRMVYQQGKPVQQVIFNGVGNDSYQEGNGQEIQMDNTEEIDSNDLLSKNVETGYKEGGISHLG
ncbi:uncharacterized protein LOC143883156 [Tasmannia lanceolata]|uniref:uncharacterized protein LOC143883156 n=1 Tax=Tasmannia lanceolata TaxID=3420 RepID=UPI00406301C4